MHGQDQQMQLPPGFLPGAPGARSLEEAGAQQQKMKEAEEQRQSILDQILTSEAKERLSRIGIVRAEKARAVENMLISAATQGRLPGKVTEDQLIRMLEDVSSQVGKSTKVTIQRRQYFDDEDGADNDDDL